jgi:hypothetical protein
MIKPSKLFKGKTNRTKIPVTSCMSICRISRCASRVDRNATNTLKSLRPLYATNKDNQERKNGAKETESSFLYVHYIVQCIYGAKFPAPTSVFATFEFDPSPWKGSKLAEKVGP